MRPARIGKFLGGAFATAERSRMPVVAVAIHGTRDVLPTGTPADAAQAHPLRDPARCSIPREPGSAAAS